MPFPLVGFLEGCFWICFQAGKLANDLAFVSWNCSIL